MRSYPLMSELTAKFIARHASDAVLAKRVRRLAANIWNDIVDGAVRAVGLRAELIRTEFPELRAWSPSLPVRARTVVKGAAKRLLATIGRGRSAKV